MVWSYRMHLRCNSGTWTNVIMIVIVIVVMSFFTTSWTDSSLESFYLDDDIIADDVRDRFKRDDDCEAELPAPKITNVVLIHPTAARVEWTEIESAQTYHVRLKEPHSSCVRIDHNHTNATTAMLRDLNSDTEYILLTSARNSNSCSEVTEFPFRTDLTGWTCSRSSPIPGRVKSIEVTNITFEGAKIIWAPTPRAISYKVTLITPSNRRTPLPPVEVEGITLKRLEQTVLYTAVVVAVNGKHEGPPTSVKFTTKLEMPHDFAVTNSSSTSFQVSWNLQVYANNYTVFLHTYEENGETRLLKGPINTVENAVSFVGLIPATCYKVSLRAFSSRSSSRVQYISRYYTKLPMTPRIIVWNVTDHSVYARWVPVEGVSRYKLTLIDSTNEKVKDFELGETFCLLDGLDSAGEYELQIRAINNLTESLPKKLVIYTRLRKIKCLNVQKDYVEDTSLVLRWEEIPDAWYNITAVPPISSQDQIWDEKSPLTCQIINLTPGTLYKFIIRAKNDQTKDTASLPATVTQFTRLSSPPNITISPNDVTNKSMQLSWLPVRHAASYLVLVYVCDGRNRKKRENLQHEDEETLNMTEFCKMSKASWDQHEYNKSESIRFLCSGSYSSMKQLLQEGEKTFPSYVEGQGRTNFTHVSLSNMRPNTLYEVVVVAGSGAIQSKPTKLLRYTKLSTPQNLRVNPNKVFSTSVMLEWDSVVDADYYQLEVFTPSQRRASRRKILSLLSSVKVFETGKFIQKLRPSTRYVFKLTARNTNTSSFNARCTVFTLLRRPSTVDIPEDERTPNSLLVRWGQVDDASYYNVRYFAIGNRNTRQLPHSQNVSSPVIFLRNLTSNMRYEIQITAGNRYTRSPASTIAKATKLPTPENFTVVDVTDTSISFSWGDVGGRSEFKIAYYFCGEHPEDYSRTTVTPDYLLEPLRPNQCYVIKMKASNQLTGSDHVETRQHTKLSQPQQVQINAVSDKKMDVQWRSVKGADVYCLIITPLFNESQISQLSSPGTDNDVIIMKDFYRARRSARLQRDATSQLDVPSFVDVREMKVVKKGGNFFKENTNQDQEVFADLNDQFRFNVTNDYIIISNLKSSVKYKVELQAVNQQTSSQIVTKQRFTELRQPQSLEARDVTNTTIALRWRPVDRATHYKIHVTPTGSNSFAASKRGLGNTSRTEILVQDLYPNINYNVILLAENNHVTSVETKISQRTKLSPVEDLRVLLSSVTHSQFYLKWGAVNYAENYKVEINPPNVDGTSDFVVLYPTELMLRRLRDGTKYDVTVIAKNSKTIGMSTSIVQFTKLLRPENVTIIPSSVTSTSFMIQWIPVLKANRYRVEVENQTHDGARLFFTERYSFNVTALLPGSHYRARIIAEDTHRHTFSDAVEVELFTKLETPRNVTIENDDITESSMYVTWEPVPLATAYIVRAGVQSRDGDHHRIHLRLNKLEFRVETSRAVLEPLLSASYYLVEVKATNQFTESFSANLYKFTKMPRPKDLELQETIYMDTEAEFEWLQVDEASYYVITISRIMNSSSDETANRTAQLKQTLDILNITRVEGSTYYTVTRLLPMTHYSVSVEASNHETYSKPATFDFFTKSECSGDFHFFPKTHLSQALPSLVVANTSKTRCLELCCQERTFECLSVSIHRSTLNCLLYAEDRNTAPPLSISKDYDHYERKFWREVSGFQMRSITHNNVAVMNKTVELILTFVYLGKTGCVAWDFGDGGSAYQSILNTDCSYLCERSENENCFVNNTSPNEDGNQIIVRHDYDMEDVFEVSVNVTDFTSYELKEIKIAINQRGCIYPSITIEEEGKNIKMPKVLHRSKKLLLSATTMIACQKFPGVSFDWGAVSYASDHQTIIGSIALQAKGSEILVPPLTFELGLYRLAVAIEVLDEEHDLRSSDAIFIRVIQSPLVARIKGGSMRTVGAGNDVTWNSESVSYDPDLGDDVSEGLDFTWFCRSFDDDKFRPLRIGRCIQDVNQIIFTSPGSFHLNTSLMQLYVPYVFSVYVKKGSRESEYQQTVVVKEGNPPDFYIKCVDNCQKKMNPSQLLGLQTVCYNCKAQRNPIYEWTLYEVVSSTGNQSTTKTSSDFSENDSSQNELIEMTGWDANTTTGSSSPIVVLNKNSLIGGRRYMLRINITMDGLDGRVFSFADFDFPTNLPPYGGVCSTASEIGNCFEFIKISNQRVTSVSHRKYFSGKTIEDCQEHCCLTREFMCLSLNYNSMTSECWLFGDSRKTIDQGMINDYQMDFYERIFYRGGAVVDEIILECKNWKDEGELQSYPLPGERAPQASITYKFTTVPDKNGSKPLLLYFGSVQKTPGVSMGLGNPAKNFSVHVVAQVCDAYGECAFSNLIRLQITPPTSNIGQTLTGMTSGNASKLGILSETGNSKAAAQLVQSISSLINDEDNESEVFATMSPTTNSYTTTDTPTTTASSVMDRNRTSQSGIGREEKVKLRANVVNALSEATSSVTSLDNLQQMTSAMNAITRKSDQIDETAQKQASNSVKNMAGNLQEFSQDSNKEDVAVAAENIIGSLGSVTLASKTNLTSLQEQLSRSSEINYNVLDEEDLSPDEYEYYNKKKLIEEKKSVSQNSHASHQVMQNSINAMSMTGRALLSRQMEGEVPVDVKSDNLQMKVEKNSPSKLSNRDFSTDSGTSVKLPDVEALLGERGANSSKPVDLQVTSFDDNPFSFGDDAAFINSPVTMLKLGKDDDVDEDNEADQSQDDSKEVGVSVPSKFDPLRDMVTIVRDVNDTGFSISKFELKTRNNSILFLVEPEDARAEFEVLLKLGSKPTEDEYDYQFKLPKKIWEVDAAEDRYKIFIKEDDVIGTGVYFVGIKDKLNITSPLAQHGGHLRRRRSVGELNSTTYHLMIATPGCRRFDQKTQAWTSRGCRVSEHSTPEVTQCTCLALSSTSIFSAEFFVPPNTINFATVFAKINIAENPAVFSTVIAIIGIYLLMLVWARRADINDAKKWSMKLTSDNRKEDRCLYQVTVFTGHRKNSSTHSKVSLVVFGDKGKSRPRRLNTTEDKTPFLRSSVVHFLIREPQSLGNLTHIHIWHDNSGKGEFRNWYLDQIVLHEVATGERFFFICDRWLAVDEDDGKVDRVIPLASPENMSTFHRLFISTSAEKLTEDHLWISVFYRPTKSNFDRKQRLSCCIALLFMTMITNAMFFEAGGSSDKVGTASLRVGPFMFSPLQLWTSFCSTLLVVPATTIIMMLFKKAKTKHQERIDKKEKEALRKAVAAFNMQQKHHISAMTLPAPSDLAGCDAVYQINSDGTINTTRKVKRTDSNDQTLVATWPHYCVYIAWTLTWSAVLLSGFFAILYSFEWGRDKAERWLSNMMLSFWQSVLIVQPIKVILLAMFVATIVKKPSNHGLNSVDHREVNEVDQKFVDLCSDSIESSLKEENVLAPPKPPSKRKLRRARRLRRKEKAMTEIIWEIFVYFIYIMILLFLCHASRDVKGQRITQQMKKTFVTTTYGFQSVSSVENFWRFVNRTLLPNLYPTHWYNGVKKTWRNRNFISDGQSYRVGPARLRQIRVKEKTCSLRGMANKDRCRSAFLLHREEKADYKTGWIPESNMTSYTDDDLINDPSIVAWRFQDWIQLKGIPFIGKLSTYPGNGYSAELGVNFKSGSSIVQSLYRDSWINQQTRAVFVEFTLYNPNVNLFTGVQLLAEFPPVGAAVTFTSIITFRLYHYVGALGSWIVISQVIFVLHMIYLTFATMKSLYRERRAYFRSFWNDFELFVLILDWVVSLLFIVQGILTNTTLYDFHENKRKYVNFQQVTTINTLVGNLLAILAFSGIIRFLKLLRFNRKVGMLTAVLKRSAKQWPGFFVLSAIFFIAFIHIGYLIYSPFLEDFRTIIASTETVFSMMMGRPLYHHLRGLYKVFGPVYYFVFCFTAAFLIINILIAIINESYGLSSAEAKKNKNDYEVIDFMMKRFAKWSGFSLLQSPTKGNLRKKPRVSPAEAPLPPLSFAVDERINSNYVKLQKSMDRHIYNLERKYNKYLDLEHLRDEVIAEMGKVPSRNNAAQLGVLLDRKRMNRFHHSTTSGSRNSKSRYRPSSSRSTRSSNSTSKKETRSPN